MTYIALARKWRPRTFSELLGQEHLTRALTQSLTQNRVHHAYLFTGTRGVGKTSVARILAKALNCIQGLSAQPCLQCDHCQAIEQGRFIDLIEIDAASKTRVEDTREVLDNVQYAPTIGRFKVYLIDEVHMLSQHSFNALLKTLEEPPQHVKFLLATTDVQKIPVTILSRCIQFHLKHVSEEVITAHLEIILHSEQVEFERPALDMIAKAARGSMRDALSLLDQGLASRTDTLSAVHVAGLLGQTTEDHAMQLLRALCAQDPHQLIDTSRRIAQAGGAFRYVLDELLAYLHRIAIIQAIPTKSEHLPIYYASEPEIAEFAQQLSAEDTQLFYQIGLKGLSDLAFAPSLLIGFEMTLLRMYTFRPAAPAGIPKLAYQQTISPSKTPDHSAPQPPCLPETPILTVINDATVLEHEPIAEQGTVQLDNWANIVEHLDLSGLAWSAMQQTELVDKQSNQVTLKVATAHQSVFTKPIVARIEHSLSAYYQEPIRLNLQYQQASTDSPAKQKSILETEQQIVLTQALQNDPVFQHLQKEFSASLIKESIAGA